MSEPDARPWDRLPDEPAKWYERFDAYRLLGPLRSLERAWRREAKESKGKQGGRPSRQWYEAAKRYSWQERAEAWDEADRPRRQRLLLAELDAARRRHARAGRLMQRKARKRIKDMAENELRPDHAMQMLAKGVEIEAKALAEPSLEGLQAQVDAIKRTLAGDGNDGSPKPGA